MCRGDASVDDFLFRVERVCLSSTRIAVTGGASIALADRKDALKVLGAEESLSDGVWSDTSESAVLCPSSQRCG